MQKLPHFIVVSSKKQLHMIEKKKKKANILFDINLKNASYHKA